MEKPLILIADDAMFMRKVIKRALSQGGYDNFVEAGDGVEAVEKYKEYQPDLMLLDITMPERSGLEVLNEVLAFNRNAKVIMCSAVGQEQVIAEAIRCGASDFIIKPFKDEEILKIVTAYEGRKRTAVWNGGRNAAGNGEYRNRKQHGFFIPYHRRKGVLCASGHEEGRL